MGLFTLEAEGLGVGAGGFDLILWKGAGAPGEFPVAVEKLAPGRLHAEFGHGGLLGGEGHFDGVGGHLFDAEDCLVFPVWSGVTRETQNE